MASLSMLGLGQIGLLQQMNNKSDTASCSVFVSNVSFILHFFHYNIVFFIFTIIAHFSSFQVYHFCKSIRFLPIF